VIVVEARRRSGSLITVRHALNQGREVFVVPGPVEGPFAEGTNQLLRDGARPIRNARDVFEDLGIDAFASGTPGVARPSSGPEFVGVTDSDSDSPVGQILSLLEQGPRTRDALSERLSIEPGALAQALLQLELANRVVLDRDGRLQLNWA
jgi:DNA processing protein